MGKKSRLKKETRQGSGGRAGADTSTGRFPKWLLLLVAAAAILIFARSIPYEFVYDDEQQVVENTWIRDWSHLGKIFTSDVWAFARIESPSNYYRPLHMVAYVIAYSVGGPQPHAFHIISILLHALCSVMVSLIGFRLTRNLFCGMAAGLLFAVHPIHAESVAWISGITDPLCAAFYFPALYFYLRDGQEEGNRISILLVLGCFSGALLSKEMAFTFPLIAGWLDWCLYRKLRWSRYALFAGLFAGYALLRVAALGSFSVQQVKLSLDPIPRILSTIVLLAQYIAKLFVPYGISAFHVFEPTTSILSSKFAGGVVLLAAFAAVAWWLRRLRVHLFLLGYCFLTILPVLNFSGIGQNLFADRYLYIPTLGSCLLIPLLAQPLVQLWSKRPHWISPRLGMALLAVLLAAFALKLWHEIVVWRDVPTLYQETFRRSPGASLIAHNLGRYYFYRGDLEQARAWESKALEASAKSFIPNIPNLANIHQGLGAVDLKQGKLKEALEHFMRAYKERPGDEALLQNLATAYISLNDLRQALFYLDALARSNPRNEVAFSDISAIFLTIGQHDLAIANARKALAINPGYANAWLNLARSYGARGAKEEGLQAYRNFQKTNPSRAGMVDAEMKALLSR